MNFVRTSTDMVDMSKVIQVKKEIATASSGSIEIGQTMLKILQQDRSGTLTLFGAEADEMWEAMGKWMKREPAGPYSLSLPSPPENGRVYSTGPETVKVTGQDSPTVLDRPKREAVKAAANAVKLEQP